MITAADVKLYLGLDPKDTFDDVQITNSVKAAVAYLNRVRADRDWRYPADDEREGMIMLAARLFERRGSNDTENSGFEYAGPTPLINNEMARLLGLDRYFGPATA